MATENHYIYIKNEDRFITVDDELYHAYYQDIWAYRKRMQRSGQCKCPKRMLPYCDADCLMCEYYSPAEISLDKPDTDNNISILDILKADSEPEKDYEKESLLEEVRNAISELPEEEQQLCAYLSQGLTYSQIFPLLGAKNERSIKYKVKRLKETLKKRFGEKFFENF